MNVFVSHSVHVLCVFGSVPDQPQCHFIKRRASQSSTLCVCVWNCSWFTISFPDLIKTLVYWNVNSLLVMAARSARILFTAFCVTNSFLNGCAAFLYSNWNDIISAYCITREIKIWSLLDDFKSQISGHKRINAALLPNQDMNVDNSNVRTNLQSAVLSKFQNGVPRQNFGKGNRFPKKLLIR